MTTPRFLVSTEALTGHAALLTGSELHHLRVRRLRVGDTVVLSDGCGQQRQGTVAELCRQHALIRLSPDWSPRRESPLRLVLAQALLKADKMDLVIGKATELGVSEFLLFTSERSLGQPSPGRRARWERVARSAAKQCQRSTVPPLGAPVSFGEILSHRGDLQLLFSEQAGAEPVAPDTAPATPGIVIAVVGPEGGFSTGELQRAAASGFRPVTLGPRIIRAETAAIVVVTVCQLLWGDLGEPH